ncbi:MAG: hypothetical protein MI975_00230 [Cytophagales bacterium]|nr:hypothetical protein [Cytophagales bacterium]
MNLRLRQIWVLWAGLSAVLSSCSTGELAMNAGDLQVVIGTRGQITGLIDSKTKREYFPEGMDAPVLAIRVNGAFEHPSGMIYDPQEKSLTLNYEKSKVQAVVLAEEKDSYLTFELKSITPEERVEIALWGPYPTTIKQTVGETVGVVRNDLFAIGIQALNIKTLGGFPSTEDDVDKAYDIFATSSLVDVSDSVKVFFRGQTAKFTDFGSVIQAYTRNRAEDRVIPVWKHKKYEVPTFDDGGLAGSKIALFGSPEAEALEVIGKIELNEGLPHPVLDGQWAKTNPRSSASYLIMGFGENNLDDMIDIAKKAGLKYLYHGGPFKTWGHFQLNEMGFPDNWQSMKRCVDRAKNEGIELGVHTLSNFITTNDPYVTPVPDKRLAVVGRSELTLDVNSHDRSIGIKSPDFFNQMENNNLHAVVVGDEIIRYERVSDSAPWTLINCQRGAFHTKATAHKAGEEIRKLMDHGYKTFLTNSELGDEVAVRLADLFNKTGLKQISFDGLEGNWSTGMGQYGRQLFVKKWYDNLKPELQGKVINDASNPGHFFWHIFTRMNWGEPWYAGFRESQTKYRLMNIDYFRRNLMPAMLGWFRFSTDTSLEDVEWLMARSAGYDAGFGLSASPASFKSETGRKALEAIKQWETARLSGAFTPDQKKRMEHIGNEFRLETISGEAWMLYQFALRRYEHKQIVRQPGEPLGSSFKFENPNSAQPLRFIIRAPKETAISNPSFDIDNFQKAEFPILLPAGHYFKYEGGENAVIYSGTWEKIASVSVDLEKLRLTKGSHTLIFDCTFNERSNSAVKLEIKTIDEGEKIKAG